jgi:hypothetical protein
MKRMLPAATQVDRPEKLAEFERGLDS